MKMEVDESANRLTLPYHFHEPDSPANDPSLLSGVCSFPAAASDVPPYWFDFSGNPLAGKFKSVIPSEYFVSPVPSGSGLRMRASFGGQANGSGVIYETAYFHEQACDAGGMEFGFYRNVIAGQTVFYISNNSNCGIQPNGYCHVSDSYSSTYMNEDNYPGQALTTNINGWVIDRLRINGTPAQFSDLDYSAYIGPDRSAPNGYRFQVEVSDPSTSKPADCDVYDTSGKILRADKPCVFPVRPGGWYRIDRLQGERAGYVTVGIQRQGTPATASGIDFAVERVEVPNVAK
jgi:hypothetical protein